MKLKLINDLDPFSLDFASLDYSLDGIPPISNMDIVAYFVLSHSFYTKEQMKAYKSLQSYKYFESGFVQRVGSKLVGDLYILLGKIKHSQHANLKPLLVWVLVGKDGSISTAHCTCMAGNSEVCSHVGAILFAAEYANRIKDSTSCTDVKASWPIPCLSTNIPIVQIKEMDFGEHFAVHEGKTTPALTGTELCNMLKTVEEIGNNAVLMRIVEPFATNLSDKLTKALLSSLLEIFDVSLMNKSYSELIKIGEKVDINLKEDDSSSVEEATRGQSQTPSWFSKKAGRITASKFKAVCRTNLNSPSISLIKSICYPTKVTFTTKATLWGISHEHVAVKEYFKNMNNEHHESFIINDVGLIISRKWPQLAASPDRLVFCECCGGGCLEVKCPYLLKTNKIQNINDYLLMKNMMALNFHHDVILPELLGRYFTQKSNSAKTGGYCICSGIDDGSPMIKCDHDNCEIEWIHFDCVGLTEVPVMAWFCQKCINS